MSVLTIIQDTCLETGVIDAPSVALTSTNLIVKQMVRMLNKMGQLTRKAYPWTQLNKEYTFSLVSGQANYALPGDWDWDCFETHWNRTTHWRLLGPMSPQDWQLVKSGLGIARPFQRYRIKGCGTSTFYIDPTPTDSNAGNAGVLEYQSLNWVRPKDFVSGINYVVGEMCWYDDVYYTCTTAGTETGFPWMSPSLDWDSSTSGYLYDTPLNDTDETFFDHNLMVMAVKAAFKREKRLDGWEDDWKEWEEHCRLEYGKHLSAKTLSLDNRQTLPWPNIPRTGINSYHP